MTLAEIVEQLEFCDYQCEGGPLTNNIAFIELKRLGQRNNILLAALREITEGAPTEDDWKVPYASMDHSAVDREHYRLAQIARRAVADYQANGLMD